jgi:HlyD family secretion protein
MESGRIPRVVSRGGWIALSVAVVTGGLLALGRQGSAPAASGAQDTAAGKPAGVAVAGTPTAQTVVVALARLVPSSGVISVGARPGMRVDRILVKEGDKVKEGDVLAILEGRDGAEQQVRLALAQQKRAVQQRASRADALAIEHAQTDQTLKARLDVATRVAAAAKKRLADGKTLHDQFAATLKGKERYDAEMALDQLAARTTSAELDERLLEAAVVAQNKKRSLEARELTEHGPEDEVLGAQIAAARAALRETEVRGAAAGQVLRVLVHPGETSTGAILEVGDLSTMSATAEVYQSDLPRVRLGDPAELDILGDRVTGTVTRISSIVGRNQLTSVDPRALRDLRVAAVTIALERSDLAARYVNMEVDATIRPSGEAHELRETTPAAGGQLP